MAIFNSYVKLPEGKSSLSASYELSDRRVTAAKVHLPQAGAGAGPQEFETSLRSHWRYSTHMGVKHLRPNNFRRFLSC